MIDESPINFDLGKVEYVPMREEHIAAVRHMESLTFSETWSVESYKRELTCGYGQYYVALYDGDVVASAGGWLLYDEFEVTNVIVSPWMRHRGIGERLFCHMINDVVNQGCDLGNLEVRYDNEPAKTIYKKFGFKKIGIRKKYYDGVDDAWMMQVENMQQPAYLELLQKVTAELRGEGR